MAQTCNPSTQEKLSQEDQELRGQYELYPLPRGKAPQRLCGNALGGGGNQVADTLGNTKVSTTLKQPQVERRGRRKEEERKERTGGR